MSFKKVKVAEEGKEFINRAFKYRIWPNKQQAEFIFDTIRACRFIYNKTLAEKINFYELHKNDKEALKEFKPKKYSYYKTLEEYEFLKKVDASALSYAVLQLNTAFKRFYDKNIVSGFPKFKKYHNFGSYSTCNNPSSASPIIRFNDEGKLLLPKIRDGLDIHVYKPIEGIIKSATIEKYPSGKYYVALLTEIERDKVPIKYVNPKNTLGISQGINNFCLFDNGEVIKYPEFYKSGEDEIKKEHAKLKLKKSTSNNYQKQRIKLAKVHEHIANKRKYFSECLSKTIADKYDAVFIEKIVVAPIVKGNENSEENKTVYDNGFGLFKTLLKYKMEERGKKYVEIKLDNDDNGGTISRAVMIKRLGLSNLE